MRHLATTLFILVGVINLFPAIGLLGAERLETLYGVSLVDENLLLLMRHRAALFAIIGSFIIFSAIRTQWRTLATVGGLVSMLSYVLLALPPESHSTPLQRVFWIDVVASVLLVCGYLIWRRHRQ